MRSESAVSNLSIEGRPILLSSNQEHVSRAAQANKNHDARPANYTQQQQEQNQSTQIAEIVPSVISSDSEDEEFQEFERKLATEKSFSSKVVSK